MLEVYLSIVAWVTCLSLGFLALERLWPAEPGQPIGRWLFNMAYAPFALALALAFGTLFNVPFALVLHHTGGGLLPVLAPEGSGPLRLAAFALLYAFVWDLVQYAMHRWQHSSAVLWETHRFHHDETALNAATQTRVHPTSSVMSMAFHGIIIVLFGPQVPHFIAAYLMSRFWGFVNHANLPIGFGRGTILLASPQWHRIHHSLRPEHRDRNFATFFPIIDWMFGTYYKPRKGEYPPTGIDEAPISSLNAATVRPFVAWYGMARSGAGAFARRLYIRSPLANHQGSGSTGSAPVDIT